MQERRTLSKNSDDIIVDGVRYVKFEGCHLFWAALNVGASDEYDIGTLFYTNTTDYTPARSSKWFNNLENGDPYSFKSVQYFPTRYDFLELIDNTNLSETVINGTTYTKFSDKKNPNKYILFPRNDGLKYSYLANQATTSLAKSRFTYNRSIADNPTLYFSSWAPGTNAASETTKSYCTMGLISGSDILAKLGSTYNYLKNSSTKYTLYSYPVYVRPVIYNEEISFPCYHRVFYNRISGLQQKPETFGTYIENEYDGYLAGIEIYVPQTICSPNGTNSIASYSLTCIGYENYLLHGQSGQSGGITNKGLVAIPNNTTNYPRELTFEITRSDGASVTFTLIQEPASS